MRVPPPRASARSFAGGVPLRWDMISGSSGSLHPLAEISVPNSAPFSRCLHPPSTLPVVIALVSRHGPRGQPSLGLSTANAIAQDSVPTSPSMKTETALRARVLQFLKLSSLPRGGRICTGDTIKTRIG